MSQEPEANWSVSAALHSLANIYEERNATYGDSYHRFGEVLEILFPEGLTLKGANDFNRFIAYFNSMGKLVRYAPNFELGGHADSLDDCSVYSQMLRQLDWEKMNDQSSKKFDTILRTTK